MSVPDRPEPFLVLWDIDQTLVSLGGVGLDSYAAAFARTTGRAWDPNFRFAGHTERAMVVELFRFHGLDPAPPVATEFLAAVEREHRLRAPELAVRGRVLAGAAEALAALEGLGGVRQSVLTGNLRAVAVLKIETFGLGRWLDLAVGAYGDEDLDRADLLPRAWRRAERHRHEVYRPARTVVMGDTVRDVAAAQAHGAGTVAVATGATSTDRLRAAGADSVLDDLADSADVVRAVRTALAAAARRSTPGSNGHAAGNGAARPLLP